LTPVRRSFNSRNQGRWRSINDVSDLLDQPVIEASIYRLPIDPNTPELIIYACMERYIMSSEKKLIYGYPMEDPKSGEEGKVIIPTGLYPSTPNYFNSNQRTCSRCKTVFQVKENGTPVVEQRCYYHRGFLRFNNNPYAQNKMQTYSCCGQVISSLGCKVSDAHVVDGSGHPDFDRGFVKTQPKALEPGSSPGVYALDCEMVSYP
jgi:hypothetical protein